VAKGVGYSGGGTEAKSATRWWRRSMAIRG